MTIILIEISNLSEYLVRATFTCPTGVRLATVRDITTIEPAPTRAQSHSTHLDSSQLDRFLYFPSFPFILSWLSQAKGLLA